MQFTESNSAQDTRVILICFYVKGYIMIIKFLLCQRHISHMLFFTKVIKIVNLLCYYLLILLKLSSLATVAMVTPGTDHEHRNLITS